MNIKQLICALLLLGSIAVPTTVLASNPAPKKDKPDEAPKTPERKESKKGSQRGRKKDSKKKDAAPKTPERKESKASYNAALTESPLTRQHSDAIVTTPTRQRVGNAQPKKILTLGLQNLPCSHYRYPPNRQLFADQDEKKVATKADTEQSSIYYLNQLRDSLFNEDFSQLHLTGIDTLEEYRFLCRNLLNDAFIQTIENNIFSEKRPTSKKEAGITRDFAKTYIMVTSAPQAWLKTMLSAAYDIPAEQRPLAKKILAYFCSQLCRTTGYTPNTSELSTWMGEAINTPKQYREGLIDAYETCHLEHYIRTGDEQNLENVIAITKDIVAAVNKQNFKQLPELYARLHQVMPSQTTAKMQEAIIKCLQKLCTQKAHCLNFGKHDYPFAKPFLGRRGLEELYMTLSPILADEDCKQERKAPRKSSTPMMCVRSITTSDEKYPGFFCDGHILHVILSKNPLTNGTVDFNGGHFLTRKVSLQELEFKEPMLIDLPKKAQHIVGSTVLDNFDPARHDPDGKLQTQWIVSGIQIDARDPKTGIIKAVWQIHDATDTKAPVKTKDSTLFPQCYNAAIHDYIKVVLRATQDSEYAKMVGITVIDEPYEQQQSDSLTLYGCKIEHPHSLGCYDITCTCKQKAPVTVQLYYFINHKRVPVLILESMYPIFPEKQKGDSGSGSTGATGSGSSGSTQSASTGSTQSGSAGSTQSGSQKDASRKH